MGYPHGYRKPHFNVMRMKKMTKWPIEWMIGHLNILAIWWFREVQSPENCVWSMNPNQLIVTRSKKSYIPVGHYKLGWGMWYRSVRGVPNATGIASWQSHDFKLLVFQCSLDFPSDFLDLGGPWGRPTSRSRGKMITWAEMPLTFVAKWMSCQIHTWKKTCLSLTKIRTL